MLSLDCLTDQATLSNHWSLFKGIQDQKHRGSAQQRVGARRAQSAAAGRRSLRGSPAFVCPLLLIRPANVPARCFPARPLLSCTHISSSDMFHNFLCVQTLLNASHYTFPTFGLSADGPGGHEAAPHKFHRR